MALAPKYMLCKLPRVLLSTFLEFAALCNAGHGFLVQGPVILSPSSELLLLSSLLS